MDEKNTREWNLKYSKAAHQRAVSNFVGNVEENRKKFIDLRRYAEGYYDVDKFKNVISSSGNTAFLNLKWDVSTPLKAIVQNVTGQLSNQVLKVAASCKSPLAQTQYDKEYRRLKAQAFLATKKEELKRLGVDVDSKINKSEVAKTQNEDEIELYMNLEFKDSYTIAMNEAINYVFASNDSDYIKNKIIRDLVVCGRGAVKVDLDENGDIILRYADVANVIHSEVDKDNFSDAKYVGEYMFVTIDEIAESSDGAFDEKQLFQIAQEAKGKWGNPDWSTQWGYTYYPNVVDGGRPYGRFKVQILNVEYKSFDKIKYEKVPAKGGGHYWQKVGKNPKKKAEKVVEKQVENIYQCTYVVGTDFCYNYGLKPNMIRERIQGGYSTKTDFGYVIFAPDIYDMKNKSLVEQLIADSDQIVILKLKAQQLVAKMRPSGYAVDAKRVSALTNGLGQKNFNPRDYIDVYEQTGIFVYASSDEAGQQQGSPITLMPESLAQGLQYISMQLQEHYRSMELVSGVPMSTIGAPSKDSLVGLEKIASENRNNSLRYLNNAYKDIIKRAATQTYLLVQDSIKNGKNVQDYVNSIGDMAVDTFKFAEDFRASQFNIQIEVAPDIVEQAEFNEVLKVALQSGNLKESDVIALRKLAKDNLDLAQRYMEVWENRYQQQKLQQDTIRIQTQSQSNAQAAMAQNQGEMMKITHEYKLKAQLETLKARMDAGLSAQEALQELKKVSLEGEQKIEQILTAMMGQDMSGEGDGSATSDYDRIDMPKASGVRMPSLGANPNNQKPNI